MQVVLLVVIAFCAGLSCGLLYKAASDIDARLTRLEEAQISRLTPKAAAAEDDSISALITAGRRTKALQDEANELIYWIEQASKFARGIRGEVPYDPDEPTGNNHRRN